jgi:DNA mismatch repair protein MutS2
LGAISGHTQSVLEFSKLLPELARRADSAWGKELALALRPAPELREAEARAADLREWLALAHGDPVVGNPAAPDVRPALDRAGTPGAILDPEELLDVARVATVSREVGAALAARAPDAPRLAASARTELERFPALEAAIGRAIDERGEVRDGASPELKQHRRRIAATRDEIRERLERIAARIGGESFTTERSGRWTVAVPTDSLGRVRGVVHDRSSSGGTVFLEPLEIVELGNRLREAEEAERAEVRRILAALSAQVGSEALALSRAAAELARLDQIQAAARLFRDWECVLPELRAGGPIRVHAGRHPLLALARAARGEEVVPLDLELGVEARLLVITGPNMGGKTVALKTLGLLTLMGMAGLGVPAGEGTVLGFFPHVVADIGDEQSIEENLSTFASHVRRLREALLHASPAALVLLDELGSGTDPAEGAALGRAILEALAESGALGVVTTHHGVLKEMATSHPAIANASMAFAPDTFAPLYRLVPGVPGRSLGLEVAERLGFAPEVLARARELVPETERRVAALVTDLEARRLALAEEEAVLAEARVELGRLLTKHRTRLAELRQMRDRVLAAAGVKSEAAVAEAERLLREARHLLRQAQAGGERLAGGTAGTAGRELETLARALRSVPNPGAARAQRAGRPAAAGGKAVELEAVKPGGSFWVPDLDALVEVVEPPDGAGRVLVRRGAVRLRLGIERLREPGPEAASETAGAGRRLPLPAAQAAGVDVDPPASGMELDLRGMSGDEGVSAIERYLEEAVIHGYRQVRIIHGKGTGALRARIQEYLRHHPRVEAFRLGELGEGGAGVTVAEIA